MNGASIGAHVLVGAGSLVPDDVAEGMVAFGVPAREVRPVSDEDF
jgi:serine acetyltransferase